MSKPRVIAFYLPQYHPNPDNDNWWGKGFTEWTNVGKASKLFPGHYQPKIPADLGYYDLRLPEVREQQAELAKEAGIEGFCYWHYWFGNKKEILERPFKEVLESGNPDFPFCLGWANLCWKKKSWNKDEVGDIVIQPQIYGGEEDYTDHFYSVLPAFKDNRYLKADNKPIFLIYRPFDSPEVPNFMKCWDKLAKKEGLDGIYWIAHCADEKYTYEEYFNLGFEHINTCYILRYFEHRSFIKKLLGRIIKYICKTPTKDTYLKASSAFYPDRDFTDNRMIPTIITGWDHTPRSGRKGVVMTNYTPETFRKVLRKLFEKQYKAAQQNTLPPENLIFLKSWNEWGEGNFIEPELRYGKQFLSVLKEELNNYKSF